MNDNQEIPSGWEFPELEEVLDIQGGSQPPKSNFIYKPQNGYIQLLQIRDFGEKPVPTYVPINKVTKFCKKEEILIARYGASLGRIVTGLEGAYNVALAKVIDDYGVFVNRYLYYLLQTQIFQAPLALLSRSAQNGFAKHEIAHIKLPLPPLPEQQRIVVKIEELFNSFDKGIENLKTAQQQLKVYRQAVLKWAFEGKLTEEWRVKNPYTEKNIVELSYRIQQFNAQKDGQDIPRRLPPMNFKDVFDLPFGWEWTEAHKVCSSVRDGTHDTPKYVEKGIPLITSKNLKNGNIDYSNVDYISEEDHAEISKRSAVEIGDILFGMIGTIGNPVIITHDNHFSIKNVGLFKKNEAILLPKYLNYWLQSWVCEHILKENDLIKGTTQKFIALGGLRVLPVPLSSIEEQQAIVAEIESRLSVCDKIEESIEQSLRESESLRQSILKKAFEGKLFSQDPNDEPASKLLERIKVEREKTAIKKRSKN